MSIVLLNFKTYAEASGLNAEKLANIAKDVSAGSGVRIIVAPQSFDILRTSPIIETFAQHIDPINPGVGTGFLLAEAAKSAGAKGSLLNHSEHRISIENIDTAVKKLRALNMVSVVCAKDSKEAGEVAKLNPDFIAIEPPELISSGISVSKAKPEAVTSSIAEAQKVNPEIKVLCGAGITTAYDVKKAKELGVSGVLLASAFAKAADPKSVLEDLVKGFG